MANGTAVLSDDGVYRYELWRTLDVPLVGSKGAVAFCMLNPSTADAATDDPTIRRCMGYARRWGYHKLAVVNLYPYRAASPADWRQWLVEADPTEYLVAEATNATHIDRVLGQAKLWVAAWGNHGHGHPVAHDLLGRLGWYALGLTKQGAPVHPLYQRADVRPGLLVHENKWRVVGQAV